MPTRTEYVRYLRSLEGGYGPAKGLRNNDNPFNTWYYGRRVSGDDYAWCAVTECYAENHFDILMINGGKVAYVPNMVSVAKKAGARVWHKPRSVPKQGTSWVMPGNKITFDFNRTNEAEHTGTFVARINDHEFYATEGNTETSEFSDALALKRRNVADVLDVIELLGVDATTAPKPLEDDVPDRTDLRIAGSQALPWSEETLLKWGTEAADPTGAHTPGYGGYTSQHSTWVDTQCVLELEGLADGDKWEIANATYTFDTAGKSYLEWSEVQARGTEAVAAASAPAFRLPKGQALYVVVAVTPGDGDTSRPAPRVVRGRWAVSQDKT